MNRPNNIPVSAHFHLYEFEDPTTKTVRLDAALVWALEDARARLQKPIRITSGYRTGQHNADVGGVMHSQHLAGRAADCVPVGYPMEELRIALAMVPELFTIYEDDHVHVELRLWA